MWLPRIAAKARQLQNGQLPSEYADRFCHPAGVDSLFLKFFEIDRVAIMSASRLSDPEIAAWFRTLPVTTPGRIGDWNQLAQNLGRPGFPLAERFPIALATSYKHLNPDTITSVFEAIEADERTSPCAYVRRPFGKALYQRHSVEIAV